MNFRDDRVERRACHHQDIACDNGEPNALSLKDRGHAPQLALLSGSFACRDAASNWHRIVSCQFSGGDADEKFSGFRLREGRERKPQE